MKPTTAYICNTPLLYQYNTEKLLRLLDFCLSREKLQRIQYPSSSRDVGSPVDLMYSSFLSWIFLILQNLEHCILLYAKLPGI